ncbi:MBL fold metallo-hydrolase [Saccharopolyspora taberi]|uniref:MBL fold metallo-hydrolase n=1 Tax=Saccharopolyspora taberi TaxID=60895 RepID=A0ABN3VC33_9PSEU
MRKIKEDLWETEPEYPMPGLSTHAYLWQAPSGNVLFYNTTHEHELDRMAELGGVAHHYLSHQDEIAPSLLAIKKRFNSTLHSAAAEADVVSETAPVDNAFDRRHVAVDDIEVIPTPGHTPGSTCFLVPSPTGQRYLFTGDSIFLGADGRWTAGYIEGMSDRDALATSLAGLASLTPDVVVSSAFAGDSGVTELGDRLWADCVQEALRSLSPETNAG